MDDRKLGYGVFQWASGNVYKGEYKNDERDGYGEMYWTDGSCYQGEWVGGIQHGYGKMIFPDGSKKEGYFENNVYKVKVKISNDPSNANIQQEQVYPEDGIQSSHPGQHSQMSRQHMKDLETPETKKYSEY